MYIVLLSGGSGKRLWPLSNDMRSKQYIKLISDESTGQECSMVQRVWTQLIKSGLSDMSIITASTGQVELIKSQLGNINIAVEPERRDTFPAIALSCAYIKDKLNASSEDYVCILPVDPYTEQSYFETIKTLEVILKESNADIALMGVVPNSPSTKYGYIVSDTVVNKSYRKVKKFKEKPSIEEAKYLIKEEALWNCGVFCLKISKIMDCIKRYTEYESYDELYNNYNILPKISFDYEILEKAENIIVTKYSELWEDLGTWNTISEQMKHKTSGKCIMNDSCTNTNIVNELDIPVVALGVKELIIVASFDGILVSDKNESSKIKDVLKDMNLRSMYEERRWGTIKTLDISQNEDGFTLFRKILIFSSMSSSYHFHNERDEAITILRGRGEMIIDGTRISLVQGTSISIPRGKCHAIKAESDLEYMEIHIGKKIGDEDINRITFDWDEILRINKR